MENLFGEKIEKEVWQEDAEPIGVKSVATAGFERKNGTQWIESIDIENVLSPDPIVIITYLNGYKLSLHYSKLPFLGNKEILEYVDSIFDPFLYRNWCGTCGGEGVVDSGGQNPDGSWINIPCPYCNQKPRPIAIHKPPALLK